MSTPLFAGRRFRVRCISGNFTRPRRQIFRLLTCRILPTIQGGSRSWHFEAYSNKLIFDYDRPTSQKNAKMHSFKKSIFRTGWPTGAQPMFSPQATPVVRTGDILPHLTIVAFRHSILPISTPLFRGGHAPDGYARTYPTSIITARLKMQLWKMRTECHGWTMQEVGATSEISCLLFNNSDISSSL